MQSIAAENGKAIDASDFFSNTIFRDVVLSVASTIGLYLLASLIHVRVFESSAIWIDELTMPQFEPWHMITSFVQYTLLAPSYINVLNVYAVGLFHLQLPPLI